MSRPKPNIHLIVLAVLALCCAVLSAVIWMNPPRPDAKWPDSLDVRGSVIQMLWIFYAGFLVVSSALYAAFARESVGRMVLAYVIAAAAGGGAVALVNAIWPF